MTNNNLKPTAFNYGGDNILKSVGNVSDKLGVSPTAAPKKVAVSVPTKKAVIVQPSVSLPAPTGQGQTSESLLQQENTDVRNQMTETYKRAERFYGEGISPAIEEGKFNVPNAPAPVSFKEQTSSLLDTKDNMNVLNDWMVETRNTAKVNDKMKAIVGAPAFSSISTFRKRLADMSVLYRGRKEGAVEGFVSGQAKNVAIVGDLPAEMISRGMKFINKQFGVDTPTFREVEQIKEELAATGEYETADISRTVGMLQESLTGYAAFGKVVDTALTATKIPTRFKMMNDAQNSLKASYVNNPKMFNLVSNTAQESFEYGTRKAIGDKTYTVADFLAGTLAGGLASRLFGKQADDIRTLVSTRDYSALSKAVEEQKLIMPDATDDIIFASLKDVKLKDAGITVGEMKEAFGARHIAATDAPKTTSKALQSSLIERDVYTSGGASKRLTEVINDVNLQASKQNVMEMDVRMNGKGDLMAFKQELVSSLKTGNVVNTKKDVEELVNTLSKKYGVNSGKSNTPLSTMDAIEEAMLRPNAAISNLANPKTVSNLASQFDYNVVPHVDMDKVFKLDESVSHILSKTTPTEKQLAVLGAKRAQLTETYKQFGIDSTNPSAFKQLEDTLYNIPSTIGGSRNYYIKQVKGETDKIEAGLSSLSKKTSSSKEVEMERVFAMQQVAKLMNEEKGSYLDNLKKASSIISELKKLSVKNVNEKGLISNEIAREQRHANTMKAIEEESGTKGMYDFDTHDVGAVTKWGIEAGRQLSSLTEAVSGGKINYTEYYKAVNTPYRVLRDALGDGAAFKSFMRDPLQAEGNFLLEGSNLTGNVNKLFAESGLGKDDQLHKKFSLWMIGRRASGNADAINPLDSIKNAGNIRIDEKGNVINTLESGWKGGKEGKGVAVTDSHLDKITSEVEKALASSPKLREIVAFLDNEFAVTAERTNAFLKESENVIINPLQKYFPIRKYRIGVRTNVDEESLSLDEMFKTHINDGFLDSLKKVDNPDSYNLEIDLPTILKGYENSQLYYLHMKPEVNKMEALLGIRKENVTTFLDKDKMQHSNFSVFSPRLQDYLKSHIDNIKERGVIKQDVALSWINNTTSGLVSFSTLGFNVGSMLAQPLSLLDSAMTRKTFKYMNRWDAGEASQYSGILKQRLTEGGAGLIAESDATWRNPLNRIGDVIGNKDLQSQSLYGKTLLNSVNDVALAGIKKVDSLTSSIVWHSAFYDKLTRDFEGISQKTSLADIKKKVGDVEFGRLINYADGEMNNVMFQGSSIVNKQQIAKRIGAFYGLNTLLMKTMLNRTFYINDAFKHSSVNKLEQALYLAMSSGIDTARQAAVAQVGVATGDKEEYKFYDTYITKKATDWLYEGDAKNVPEDVRLYLNTVGTFIGSYFGGVQGYDPTQLYKKVTDEMAFNKANPDVPTFRKSVSMAEAVVQTITPGTLRPTVAPLIHKAITGQNKVETKANNATLSSIIKKDPDKQSIVSQMSWDEQKALATIQEEVKGITKELSARDKIKTDAKEKIVQEVIKAYGAPTVAEFKEYIKGNKDKFKEAGVVKEKDVEALYKSIKQKDVTEKGTDVYSMLPQNAEVIYRKQLSPFVMSKDSEGFNAEVKRLRQKGIVMDVKGFAKKINPLIEADKKKRDAQP